MDWATSCQIGSLHTFKTPWQRLKFETVLVALLGSEKARIKCPKATISVPDLYTFLTDPELRIWIRKTNLLRIQHGHFCGR